MHDIKAMENYLVATLLEQFRAVDGEKMQHQAATISYNYILRLTASENMELKNRLIELAERLKDNVSHVSIRLFANQALIFAKQRGLFRQIDPKIAKTNEKQQTFLHAKKNLQLALSNGYSEKTAVVRVANDLLRMEIKKRENSKKYELSSHPLKEALSFMINQKNAPKEDVRNHLLSLQRYPNKKGNSGILFGLLNKARVFSTQHIHSLLGDELFFLGRPIGFLDKNEETVVIEVASAIHQSMLTFKTIEILNRLKADSAFAKVKNLRFNIRHMPSSSNL